MIYPETNHESSGSRLRTAVDWLDAHKETPFSVEAQHSLFANAYLKLEYKRFIPTYLQANEPGAVPLPKNTQELGAEIGGTNIRITNDKTDESEHILHLHGTEKAFESRTFSDPDHFFETIAAVGKPVIEQAKTLGEVHAFHVIFSFPGETHKTPYGIDVTPFKGLTKGFIVPGIETINVGETMWRHYKRQGLMIPKDAVMIVPNDTAAGLMNHIAHASGVCGTGDNTAIAIRDTHGIYWVFNTEIGELTCFPLSVPEQEVHDNGNVINRHLETIVGGENMGKVFDTIIHHMVQEGIIPYVVIQGKEFTSKQISDVLTNNCAQFHELFQNFDENDDETWEILTLIATRQRERAAQALGIANAALIHLYPESFLDKEIIFPMEGSNFWKTPGFPEMVKSQIEYFIPDHTIKFVQTSGSMGATRAALQFYNQSRLSG